MEIFEQFIKDNDDMIPEFDVWEDGDFSFCSEFDCADCKISEVCDNEKYKGLHHGEEELKEISDKYPEFFI